MTFLYYLPAFVYIAFIVMVIISAIRKQAQEEPAYTDKLNTPD